MSAISVFAEKQNQYNARIDSAVAGISGDVEKLNGIIKALQDSAGTVTPEDQALLDQLQASGEAVAAKVEALDALTENVPTPPA